MRKRLIILSIIAVLAGGLAFWFLHVSDAEESAAALGAPTATPSEPIAGETITVAAKLPTDFTREAMLQSKAGENWKTIATDKSSDEGTVSFETTAPSKASVFRVVAPEVTRNRKLYMSRTTPALTLTPTEVLSSLTVLPAIAQTEKEAGLSPVTAAFSPARPEQDVRLQQSTDGKTWEDVGTAKQDKKGIASFKAKVDPKAEYRAALGDSDTVTTKAGKGAYPQQIFNDDFDGSALNSSAATGWHQRYLGILSSNMGRICSESSPNSVTVSDGSLILRTLSTGKSTPACSSRMAEAYNDTKKPVGSPSGQILTNGHVSTITSANPGGFRFQYGVAAARIKFAENQGQHGSFWTQPADKTPGTEIDIVEYFGDGYSDGGLTHVIHYKENGKSQKVGNLKEVGDLSSIYGNDDWWKDYHVYSVEWTPTEYVFRVDGTETWRTDKGINKAPGYLILSLLSSDWELPMLPRGDDKNNKMAVDWVKVWQDPSMS